MAITVGTGDFGANHEMAEVLAQFHLFFADHIIEGRPPTVIVELRTRPKQLMTTRRAAVHAIIGRVDIFARKRAFGALFPKHMKLLRGEHGLPFILSSFHATNNPIPASIVPGLSDRRRRLAMK